MERRGSRSWLVQLSVVFAAAGVLAVAATIPFGTRHRVGRDCSYSVVSDAPTWIWWFGACSLSVAFIAVMYARGVRYSDTAGSRAVSWLSGTGALGSWLWFGFAVGFGYHSVQCIYGRPLRVGRRMVVPSVDRRASVHRSSRVRRRERRAIAAHWLECARGEYASIAAFERLAAELAAVDAPEDLVDRCFVAACEEAVHAERIAALATAASGRAYEFRLDDGWTPRSMSIVELAVESLVDGCLNEGCAAREAELRSVVPLNEAAASVLAMIARDERSHAELAWSIVEWALAVDSEYVAPALEDALAALPSPRRGFPMPRRCDTGLLRSWGWIEPSICAAANADVVTEIHARLGAALHARSGLQPA